MGTEFRGSRSGARSTGDFGALLARAALSPLTVTFAGSPDRSKAFGIFGAISGAGGAIGLLLGGVLTEYLSWHWCLYVNVIIAVIAVIGGELLLPQHTKSDDAKRLDWVGTVSTGLAFLPMVAALATTASVAGSFLTSKFSPHIIVTAGLAVAACGMVCLTTIDVDSSYLTGILPGLIIFGIGAVFSSAMSLATLGVETEDAGVA